MSKTTYNIQLKGYVGGYDFDRATLMPRLPKTRARTASTSLSTRSARSLPASQSLPPSVTTACGDAFRQTQCLNTPLKQPGADTPQEPELMAHDYEGFPRMLYNEGFMSEEDFDNIFEYSDMCDKHSQEAADDYMEFHDELDNLRKPTSARG